MEKKEITSLIGTASMITSNFQRLRVIVIAAILCMAITAIACVVYSLNSFSAIKSQIYVVDRGQSFSASMVDKGVTLGNRIEFQSKNLHHLLYTITPNIEIAQANANKALEISDESVYRFINDLNEKRTYRRMQENNASQDIVVDSVKYNFKVYPYVVVTYSTVTLLRPSNITKYAVTTKCNMIDVDMNPKNREGLQVENFEVLRNEKIETRKR